MKKNEPIYINFLQKNKPKQNKSTAAKSYISTALHRGIVWEI